MPNWGRNAGRLAPSLRALKMAAEESTGKTLRWTPAGFCRSGVLPRENRYFLICANHGRTYSSGNCGMSTLLLIAQATGCWCSGMNRASS
ncbi:hypothetical protein BN406_03928 (plasmid) [Sinorhizobium meliloti Rm41]|nr:hypothetical protein BN406_03928 [Sinorhizobium meliloti Rm41]